MKTLLLLLALPQSAFAAWTITTFDPASNAGWGNSERIGVDWHIVDNTAGVPWVGSWTPGVGFRYFDGTVSESAEPSASLASELLIRTGSASIAVGTNGEPWMAQAMFDANNVNDGSLRVVHRDHAGVWTIDQAFAPPYSDPSLDVDRDGVVHLLVNFSAGATYAWRDGGGWHSELFDSTDGSAYGVLRVDRQGRPCVAYVSSAHALWFARRVNGAWQRQLVDAAHVVTGARLAFDGVGRPRIAYGEHPGVSLYFLRLTEADEVGAWTNEAITPAGTSVGEISLAVGGDHSYVAFTDFSTGLLRVASRSNGVWGVETVDPVSGAQYPSIQFNGSNEPIIAYKGAINAGGRLARGEMLVGVGDPSPGSSRLALLGANPMRAGTTIALSLTSAADQDVRLQAFDAAGRAVGAARIVRAHAGVNHLSWSGPARPGLLFLEASARGERWLARVVVL